MSSTRIRYSRARSPLTVPNRQWNQSPRSTNNQSQQALWIHVFGNCFWRIEAETPHNHAHYTQVWYNVLLFCLFFLTLLHEHAYTLSQTGRLTSCPQDFWLVNRDREPFCFLYDSAITQRLTQWNSSVTPRGFGDSEREDWIPLSVYSLSHFLLNLFYNFTAFDRQAHDVTRVFGKHANTYTRSSCICLEECVQLLIRKWIRQRLTGNASIAALFVIYLFIFFSYPHLQTYHPFILDLITEQAVW